MMAILRDLNCPSCDRTRRDVLVEGESYPKCRCGARMKNWITKVNADAWGGPQYHPALDRTFSSKSELRAYMKSRNLMECGDRVGGARNEDYLKLGKRFSYRGQRTRNGRDYAETRSHRTLAKPVVREV